MVRVVSFSRYFSFDACPDRLPAASSPIITTTYVSRKIPCRFPCSDYIAKGRPDAQRPSAEANEFVPRIVPFSIHTLHMAKYDDAKLIRFRNCHLGNQNAENPWWGDVSWMLTCPAVLSVESDCTSNGAIGEKKVSGTV